MKYLLILLTLTFVSRTDALVVNVKGTQGNNDYKFYNGSLSFLLGERLQVTAGGSSSDTYKDLFVDGEIFFENLSIHAEHKKSQTNDYIDGTVNTLGLSYPVNVWWNGDRETLILLDWGKGDFFGKHPDYPALKREYTQRKFHLGLEQQLDKDYSIGGDFTKYNYDDRSSLNTSFTILNKKYNISRSVNGVDTELEYDKSIFFLIRNFHDFEFELRQSNIKYRDSDAFNESYFGIRYNFTKSFQVLVDYTGFDQSAYGLGLQIKI